MRLKEDAREEECLVLFAPWVCAFAHPKKVCHRVFSFSLHDILSESEFVQVHVFLLLQLSSHLPLPAICKRYHRNSSTQSSTGSRQIEPVMLS